MPISFFKLPQARAAALATVVALGGCAVPGAPYTPPTLADAQSLGLADADTPAVAARWWTALGDARLDALVDRALQGHPSLTVVRARQAQALALAGLREAVNGPQAALALDASRQRYSAHGLVPPPVAGNTYDSATVQAALSWSPDFVGLHAAELQAALGQARAAQADAATAGHTLAVQVGRVYVQLARLLAQRTVAERALAQRQDVQHLTHERVGAGLDSRVELTQAQAALPDARTQIEGLDEQITLARRQLAVLSAQAPDALATLSPDLAALTPPVVPQILGADLLGRRPDVAAARWRVQAALQGVQVARAEFYPNVSLSAFVGLSALGLNQWLNAGSRQMGVAPALRLPLFDGGRLQAQLGARQAEADAAIAQYHAVVLDAVKEAGDALATLQSLARQQALQDQGATHAEQAYRLAQQRLGAGLGNRLAVLATESQLLAQRRLEADLRARQLDTRLVLMKALGGGWTDEGTALTTATR